MTDYRPLLLAAYPNKFLAKRGVSTVGGWCCLRANADANITVMTFSRPPVRDVTGSLSYCAAGVPLTLLHTPAGDLGGAPVTDWQIICDAHARGNLLPDLTDAATWNLALIDLAEAQWPGCTFYVVWWGPERQHNGTWDWFLNTHETHHAWRSDESSQCFHLPAEDPIEALLLARAQLREKEVSRG